MTREEKEDAMWADLDNRMYQAYLEGKIRITRPRIKVTLTPEEEAAPLPEYEEYMRRQRMLAPSEELGSK